MVLDPVSSGMGIEIARVLVGQDVVNGIGQSEDELLVGMGRGKGVLPAKYLAGK